MSSGIERIAAVFAATRSEGRAALMPYMMSGFPDRETSLDIARAYAETSDLVEIGVPFSDPLADGPVIHAAGTRALEQGAGMEDGLAVSRQLGAGIPGILMTYVNMILAEGPERFAARVEQAGVAGVIVPDLPFGEAPDIGHALKSRGIAPVPLIAPTTTADRRAEICEEAEGFIYLVSSVGTTGERSQLMPELEGLVEAVREHTDVPVAVGFGIGTPEQAAEVGRFADGVIIGSRLVRIAGESADPASACAEFLDEIRQALVARSE